MIPYKAIRAGLKARVKGIDAWILRYSRFAAGAMGIGTAIYWLSENETGKWPALFVIVTGVVGSLLKLWADFHFRNREPTEGRIGKLKDAVDRYCEQRGIRMLEHPWLLCSLATFVGAFVLFVTTERIADVVSWPFAIAIFVSFLSTVMAGRHAAKEPDEEEVKLLLEFFSTYEPVDREAFGKLLANILGGDLSMEPMAEFVAHERQTLERLDVGLQVKARLLKH